MNLRSMRFVLVIVLFGPFKPVVAMHGRILRGVQIGTSAVVIGVGAKTAYDLNEVIKNPVDAPEAPEKVKCMVHEGLAKLNMLNYEQVPVLQFSYKGSPWAVLNDKVVVVDPRIAEAIASGDEEVIVQGEMLKRHEFKHLLNGDGQKRAYSYAVAPCVVQAVSSGLTYSFNKISGRQKPKTIVSLAGRSLVAVGAMGPKFLMSGLGVIAYIRYQEAQADQFACEHAESRKELEAFKGVWDDHVKASEKVMLTFPVYANASEKVRNALIRINHFELDSEHPWSGDRAEMVQKYIDKWDAEHKA